VAGAYFRQAALLDEAFEAFGELGAAPTAHPELPYEVLETGAAVRLTPDVLQQSVNFHWFHYIVAAGAAFHRRMR
jgi:hypothetical protein